MSDYDEPIPHHDASEGFDPGEPQIAYLADSVLPLLAEG